MSSSEAWLVITGGLFWRPGRRGYTYHLYEAGLYSRAEAGRIAQLRDVDRIVPLEDYTEEIAKMAEGASRLQAVLARDVVPDLSVVVKAAPLAHMLVDAYQRQLSVQLSPNSVTTMTDRGPRVYNWEHILLARALIMMTARVAELEASSRAERA